MKVFVAIWNVCKSCKIWVQLILEFNFWKIEFLEASSPNFPWSSPESVPGSAKITSWTFGIRKNILFEILKYFLNHLNKFEDLSWCLSWFVLGLLVHFCSWFFHLEKFHEHCLDYTCSSFFKTRSFKKASSPW